VAENTKTATKTFYTHRILHINYPLKFVNYPLEINKTSITLWNCNVNQFTPSVKFLC